jgi:hypothetical protein
MNLPRLTLMLHGRGTRRRAVGVLSEGFRELVHGLSRSSQPLELGARKAGANRYKLRDSNGQLTSLEGMLPLVGNDSNRDRRVLVLGREAVDAR